MKWFTRINGKWQGESFLKNFGNMQKISFIWDTKRKNIVILTLSDKYSCNVGLLPQRSHLIINFLHFLYCQTLYHASLSKEDIRSSKKWKRRKKLRTVGGGGERFKIIDVNINDASQLRHAQMSFITLILGTNLSDSGWGSGRPSVPKGQAWMCKALWCDDGHVGSIPSLRVTLA
jgi:hypothetical protein